MNNQNYVQPGRILTLVAPYARATSGLGAMIGSLFGVTMDTVGNGEEGQFETEGVHELLKTEAQAWALGDKLFWNASTKLVDNDPTTGRLIGVCVEVAANPTTTGKIKLLGNASELAEGVQAAVVVLTDSTGVSGSHDDTIADALNSTAPDAVTATALGDLVATQNTGWGASTEAGFDSISTKFDAAVADITALRATVLALQSDAVISNQNVSDLTQKIIELRAVMVTAGLIAA